MTTGSEGLAWLGREPSAHAGVIVRALLRLFRVAMTTIGGIRVTVEGREHLPSGGSIAAIAAHRSWFDGPLLMSEFVRPQALVHRVGWRDLQVPGP